MTEDLIMLDDEDTVLTDSDMVVLLVEPDWTQTANVITLPKKDALRVAINLITQVALDDKA